LRHTEDNFFPASLHPYIHLLLNNIFCLDCKSGLSLFKNITDFPILLTFIYLDTFTPFVPQLTIMNIKFNNRYLPLIYLKKSLLKRCLIVVFLAFSSCNYYQEFSQPEITTNLVSKSTDIRTIAILPFKNQTKNEEISEVLRKAVFRNLSLKGYDLVILEIVDRKLTMASYHTDDINNIGHYKLGKILEADALIYGTVTKCSKLFSVVYSRITVGAEMEMINSFNSETIWEANHKELTHSGSPPFSPFNIPEKIFDSTINVRGKVVRETADNLAKKLANGIPEFDINKILMDYAINIKSEGNNKVVHYKVQPNDTLFKIAIQFYGQGSRWKNIKSANNEIQGTSLKIGYDLVLPDLPVLANINDARLLNTDLHAKALYKVKWGDSLYSLASELYHDGNKWPVIYEENKEEIKDRQDLTVGQALIIPLQWNPIHTMSIQN